jgi:hypothetical protein
MNTNLSSGKFDLGALASRRRMTAKLAGETPALPGPTSGLPPPIVIFTGPKPILFEKAADSFL